MFWVLGRGEHDLNTSTLIARLQLDSRHKYQNSHLRHTNPYWKCTLIADTATGFVNDSLDLPPLPLQTQPQLNPSINSSTTPSLHLPNPNNQTLSRFCAIYLPNCSRIPTCASYQLKLNRSCELQQHKPQSCVLVNSRPRILAATSITQSLTVINIR